VRFLLLHKPTFIDIHVSIVSHEYQQVRLSIGRCVVPLSPDMHTHPPISTKKLAQVKTKKISTMNWLLPSLSPNNISRPRIPRGFLMLVEALMASTSFHVDIHKVCTAKHCC
jgi:hypothetical protein